MIRTSCSVICWKVSSELLLPTTLCPLLTSILATRSRTEDLNRYKRVILRHLNVSGINKEEESSVPVDVKFKCKFYGNQASERILCPEQVFRGFLVSTLECQDCYHTSSRHESFLDLSLPVSVERPAPPLRRKGSPDELNASFSGKEKQKTKPKSRNRHSSSSAEESDADVEDNLSEDVSSTKCNQRRRPENGEKKTPEKTDDAPEKANKEDLGKHLYAFRRRHKLLFR